MARRTREEALETREQLLDAAERVFRERGVGHASLAEVADAAGVTRGAVYHHFESKAELFQALTARAEMPIDTAFEDFQNQDIADPLALFRQQGLQALEHLTSSAQIQNIFEVIYLRCEYTDDLAPVGVQHVQDRLQCLGKCQAVLDQAVAKGQLPANTDTHLAAHGALAFVGGLMRDWVEAPDTFDLKAAGPQLIDTYIAGLRVNPPRRRAVTEACHDRTFS